MVSATLEAGCHKNTKMGMPATITPLNIATELGLKDTICLMSCIAASNWKKEVKSV